MFKLARALYLMAYTALTFDIKKFVLFECEDRNIENKL